MHIHGDSKWCICMGREDTHCALSQKSNHIHEKLDQLFLKNIRMMESADKQNPSEQAYAKTMQPHVDQ